MAYTKQTWTDGPAGGTPMSAARLGHLEDGVAAAAVVADLGTPGTPTGDAGRAAFGPSLLPTAAVAGGATSRRFDPTLSTYGMDDSLLRRFRSKVAAANAGVGVCRILCAGDSTTAGKPSAGIARGVSDYPTYLRKQIGARGLPIAGTGIVPVSQAETTNPDARWSFTGSWADANFWREGTANGSTATFTSDLPGTVVTIIMRNGNAATWTYSIDGGAAVPKTNPTGGGATVTTITGLANTTHTVRLTQTSSTLLDVYGVGVRQTSGIEITNVGNGGSASDSLANPNFDALVFSSAYQPDLTIINIGINDYFLSVPLATYTANLTAAVNFYLPTTDVVLAVPTPVSAIYSPAKDSYDAVVYQVAEQLGVPVLDLSHQWGGYAAAETRGALAGDGTHPTPPGDAEIASSWIRALGL